jgi:carboxyl-terminal processing protease
MARACDAHSDYLTQEELEDTENEMRLTRIGIGVTLDSDPAGLRVVGLMPGGPAQKDGRLRMNDRIVAVAEESSAFRELDGMPLAQALSLLRGQRDTVVKLRVLPARSNDPAQRVIIPIRREEMRSIDGETYAKIIQYPSSNNALPLRLGWLVVPAFYGDELDSSGHRSSSVARDVGILLKRFVAEKVDGVVLDFRANLGGLLEEAVEVGGLFCGRLPIVQARAQNGEIEILKPHRLRSQKPVYSGPLVVLTDHLSASASELVAGALQDYARAVVVGGEQTFGKGSIQATIPLADYLGGRARPPVGGLALTVGKFYRVNGQSTQIRGVLPDVILPSTLDLPHEGESALVDPLPHDAITSLLGTNAPTLSQDLLETLRKRSAERIRNSSAFAAVIAERDTLRKSRLENQLSLEEADRRSALETAHRSYTERESNLETPIKGARFCRLLLEDANLKRLKFFDEDPLSSRDPESVATETEVLRILVDLAQLETHKPLVTASGDARPGSALQR